jgi:hypothetical protein
MVCQSHGSGELCVGEPRDHGDEPRGDCRGERCTAATARSSDAGSELVQELPYRLVHE